MSLAPKVLIGLLIGVAVGIFFGDVVEPIGVVGRAFVLLLQMTVIPYVFVSLAAGLGSLGRSEARTLARMAGVFLLALWGLAIANVVAIPMAFPSWKAASFFSDALVADRKPFDFLGIYIPSNPFSSMAEGVVPAVVVFGAAFGLALMGIERKQALIDALNTAQEALLAIADRVVSLAPYGVFAIAASAAGTMELTQFRGLQVYAAAYMAAALVLGLWTIPALLAALTPFRHREVIARGRDAIVTAFATGSVLVVLPVLARRARQLIEERGGENEEGLRLVNVVVPIAYTLVSAGKLLGLAFVPFAGWLSGYSLSWAEYPQFILAGLFSFFGSTYVAIPFLLDLFRIPADMFGLFVIADNFVGNRFGAMVASVHVLSLALFAAAAANGGVKLSGRRLARWAMISGALMLAALLPVRLGFESIDRPYEGYRRFIERSFLFEPAAWKELPAAPDPPGRAAGGSVLERIQSRGTIRVGYGEDRLPFAFRNDANELVGLDVELMHSLAHDLGVSLEFVRTERLLPTTAGLLAEGRIDIAIGGWAITPERLLALSFSRPYLEATLAFLVPDHLRDEFSDRRRMRRLEPLRVGVPRSAYYLEKVRQYLPQAELVELASPRLFFSTANKDIDVLAFSAEAGSAWTLIHPEFAVAVPQPEPLRAPMGFAVSQDSPELANLLDGWIRLKQKDYTIERLFDYWVRGRRPGGEKRRWSVAHDVLGWFQQASSTDSDE